MALRLRIINFFYFFSAFLFAQTPSWTLAKNWGGNDEDNAYAICNDTNGNLFVAGRFISSSINFDAFSLTNNSLNNAFVTKLDSSENVLWAKSADSNSNSCANGIATDLAGNVYVVGEFWNQFATFGSFTLSNTNFAYCDMFIVKYDSSGNVLWAKSAGSNSFDRATSVCTDSIGNAYVTGAFQGNSIAFGSITLMNHG